jgi:hypothetical protein
MDRFKLWAGIALLTGCCGALLTGWCLASATGAEPDGQPPAPASADADARIRLCKAREHYYAGELDAAQLMAGQLTQLRNIHWGYFEDSPDKLLFDIDQARARRNQEASARMLAEARALMAQGRLDEAEQKARAAAVVYRAPPCSRAATPRRRSFPTSGRCAPRPAGKSRRPPPGRA